LIDDVLAPDAHRVLEVGAGNGIAPMQMVERGADVLAVESDIRMAAVAQAGFTGVSVGGDAVAILAIPE
jgi:tRNA1(Val) A37 N6-methylase TrmN6